LKILKNLHRSFCKKGLPFMAQAPASSKKTAKAPAKSATKTVAAPVNSKKVETKVVTPKVVAAPKPVISKPIGPKRVKKIANKPFSHGTGRRKSAVAQALLRKGNGQIIVNGRPFDQYFTVVTSRQACQESFVKFAMTSGMMADIKVSGGGFTAQAGAVRLSIARALLLFDTKLKPELRKSGFLTVDSRVKERKKYGQKAARRKFQFTKR
jgi:small subunit ribosomal protein S9